MDSARQRRRGRQLIATVAAACLAALLSGCMTSGGNAQPTAAPTVTVTVEATGDNASTTAPSNQPGTESGGRCGDLAADAAAAWAADRVPLPSGYESLRWTATDLSAYDPCADLSAIVFTLDGGYGESLPRQVALFHDGDYFGTPSNDAFRGTPTIARLGDGRLTITYPFTQAGESSSTATGRTTVTATWDESRWAATMTGEFPPNPVR